MVYSLVNGSDGQKRFFAFNSLKKYIIIYNYDKYVINQQTIL